MPRSRADLARDRNQPSVPPFTIRTQLTCNAQYIRQDLIFIFLPRPWYALSMVKAQPPRRLRDIPDPKPLESLAQLILYRSLRLV
jgi:hypothetical protein